MPSYLIDTPIPKTLLSAAPESSHPALIPEEHQDPSVALDEMDDEEQVLQDLLFGKADLKSLTRKDIEKQVAKSIPTAPAQDSLGFFIDTGDQQSLQEDDDTSEEESSATATKSLSKRSAWADEDDLSVNIKSQKRTRKLRVAEDEESVSAAVYESRLRVQFEKIYPKPEWVSKKAENDEEEDGFLQSTRTILQDSSKAKILSPDKLLVTRMTDANQPAYSKSGVSSVHFHPTAPVLLTAGLDKTLRIFQVDGKMNSKLQSIHLKDLPIHSAKWTPDGSQIVMTGRRKYFYTLDVESGSIDRIMGVRGRDEYNYEKFYASPNNKILVFPGRNGHMSLLSKDTKQWIGDLKMNCDVKSIDFSGDGQTMYSFGDNGSINVWDMNMRKCISQFNDQGFIGGGSMAVSRDNAHIATGSTSGIVNFYASQSCMSSSNPDPIKVIDNLSTPISLLKFNHDGQILAMGSKYKKDAFKLFHVPSRKVFANWPTANTPLGYVSAVDFSPSGGYLAIGNDKGKVLLYKLNAYGRY